MVATFLSDFTGLHKPTAHAEKNIRSRTIHYVVKYTDKKLWSDWGSFPARAAQFV